MRFWEISRQVGGFKPTSQRHQHGAIDKTGGFKHFFCSSRNLGKWSNLTIWLIFLRWVESANLPFVDNAGWKLARRIWSSRPGQRNSALVSNAPWKWQKGEGIPPNGGEKFSGIHPEDAPWFRFRSCSILPRICKVGCVFLLTTKNLLWWKATLQPRIFLCGFFGNSLWCFFSRTSYKVMTRWWFQICFMFIPTWGRFPIWLIFFKWVETTNQWWFWQSCDMAAAQNVRSGSSPVPTHDPDLRSRPPIQTFRKDLIQTFDPDLWNDIMYWWVDVWSSDGCMLLGFLLCIYSPCEAAKQQTVVKPRCQAVTLPSCTYRKVTLLSSPAAKLQLLHIQAVKLSSWHCCKL